MAESGPSSVAARPAGPSARAAVHRWRWVALAALLLSQAMDLLDSTIVQVAAPKIHADLGGAVSDIKWFSTAYTLPFAVLLLTGGRLGDIVGRRRVFRIGVTGFMLASLACALAPSAGLLIALRIVQGGAAAAIMPQAIGLMRAMFDGRELTIALGSIGPVMGVAGVGGPVLGGVLINADLLGSSWRSAFLVNVPLCVAVLAVAPLLVEDRAPKRPGFDPVGTALAMSGTGLIVYTLNEAGTAWMSARNLVTIGVGVAVIIGFGLHQRRSAALGRTPLVERSLFASRRFSAALATSTLFFAVTTGLTLVVVLQLQLGLGSGVLTAGLTLVPWSVGVALSSWVAACYLVRRFGHRVMFAGVAVLLLGMLAAIAIYHATSPTAYPAPLLAALGVAGLGIGLFCTSFFASALHPVRPHEIGSAAGLLNAVQQLGATLGVAVLGSVYLDGSASGRPADALHAVQTAFWVAIALLVASLLTSALMTEPGRRGGAAAQRPLTPARLQRTATD
jgi:EmrB/QacA subfamily drug resistance transporter